MASIHASAVLVGARAVLIRGASGAGKSRLVFALLNAAARGELPFARLVADDRVLLEAVHGRLVASAPASIGGLIEMRGHGPVEMPHEPQAIVGWVVDLDAADATRMPEAGGMIAEILGVTLPRVAVAAGQDPLPLALRAIADGFQP